MEISDADFTTLNTRSGELCVTLSEERFGSRFRVGKGVSHEVEAIRSSRNAGVCVGH
jgi:hypothetical protein